MKKSCPNNYGFSLVLIVILISAVLAVAVAAYYFLNISSKSKNISELGKTIKTDNDTVTIKDEDGEFSVGENVKIPKDFPKDIPIYRNAKLTSISSSPPEGGFTQSSTDQVENILSWYKSEFVKNGWKVDLESVDSLNVSKGNLAGGVIVYSEEKGKYDISVSVLDIANATGLSKEEYDQVIEMNQDMQEYFEE